MSLSTKFVEITIPVFQFVEGVGDQTGVSGSNDSSQIGAVLHDTTEEQVDVTRAVVKCFKKRYILNRFIIIIEK